MNTLILETQKSFTRKFFASGRLWMILGALIIGFTVMKVMKLGDKFDPLLVGTVASILTVGAMMMFRKSVQNPIIPCMSLVMILFFIFFEKKFLSKVGLDLKAFMLIFAAAAMIAIFNLTRDFKYYWSNFISFRFIFIFFIATLIYLGLGYYSDFRLSTDLLSLSYAHFAKVGAKTGGMEGSAQTKREFGAFSQYVILIEAFIPIVAFTTALTIAKIKKSPQELLLTIIKVFVAILAIHYSCALVAPLLGTSLHFTSIAGEVDPGSNFVEPVFLLILLSFRYYFSQQKTSPPTWVTWCLNFDIAYVLLWVGSYSDDAAGSSSMIVCLLTGLPMLIVGAKLLNMDFPLPLILNPFKRSRPWVIDMVKFVTFSVVLVVAVSYFLSRMENSSGNDTASLGMRLSHWHDILENWAHDLTLNRFIFGYGIDKVRELVYYASNSSAVEQGIQSPHNLYIALLYDYGMMGLLYVAGFSTTMISSVRYLLDKQQNRFTKLFSLVNMGMVCGVGLMLMFLDMTLIVKIIFFSALGLIEALKFSFGHYYKAENDTAVIPLKQSVPKKRRTA